MLDCMGIRLFLVLHLLLDRKTPKTLKYILALVLSLFQALCLWACEIPTGLQVTALNRTDATLNWNTDPGSRFQLQIKLDGGNWQAVSHESTAPYFIEGLLPGANYQAKIRRICLTDTSLFGAEIIFQTPAAPFVFIEGGLIKASAYDYMHLAAINRQQLLSINNKPFTPLQATGFWRRSQHDIEHYKTTNNFGTTYFESEKGSYPIAMYSMMYGVANNDSAYIRPSRDHMEFLSIYDIGSDLTDRVDLFPSFTIKGQVPKYFYFGKRHGGLRATYLSRMRNAFRLWTHDTTNAPRDPLGRPNPYFVPAMMSQCWDARCRNTWVDGRNTDNLKAMRESSVYLFTEEIGNASVNSMYATRIRNHAAALFHVGYSEWDSENYYSHSVAPWLNLYTFSENEAIKKTAKGTLDWYLACGATKYFKGMFAGPSKRINPAANLPFRGVGPLPIYLYFGDASIAPTENDRDAYISMISHYRPPQALHELANKQFAKPVELINTKPPYGTFAPTSPTSPDVWETIFIGNTYQFGTCVSSNASNDTRTFKLAAENAAGTSDVFYASTTTDNQLYHAKRSGDQVGQYRNLSIYLCRAGSNKFFFQTPTLVPAQLTGETWYFEYNKTWIAIKPIGLAFDQTIAQTDMYSNHQLHLARNAGTLPFTGFAMEVAEEGDYPSFTAFKEAVLNNSILDLSAINTGKAVYYGVDGAFLEMTYNSNMDIPMVKRNSNTNHAFRVAGNYEVYRPITPPQVNILDFTNSNGIPELVVRAKDSLRGPIAQDWKRGRLRITTNNHVFVGEMSATGVYAWQELAATEALKRGAIAKLELMNGTAVVQTFTDSMFINAAETNLPLTALGLGTFTLQVRATDEEGNEKTSEPFQVTISTTGISAKQPGILVYPNPMEGKELYIEFAPTGAKVELLSLEGRVLQNAVIDSQRQVVNINQASGIYILKIKDLTGRIWHQKLVYR